MINFNLRPILVFWEATRACLLKCKHCRAEAIKETLPGELTTEEAKKFINTLTSFGRPHPVLIITGGDPLMRKDLYELIEYARSLGIPIGLAPAVTELLDYDTMQTLKAKGVSSVSISLDGGNAETHNYIRGIENHFKITLNALKTLSEMGFKLQVNTLVAKNNVQELPKVLNYLIQLKIKIWELFFLIKVGRGTAIEDISPRDYEDVMHFLYEVTRYGIEVRTVEAPFFRRIALWRNSDLRDKERLDIDYVTDKYNLGELYRQLTEDLIDLLGTPENAPHVKVARTRDGKGIIFIAYNGDVYPSGFSPYVLGNVKSENIVTIYRDNKILKEIRQGNFRGKCGRCEFNLVCGGSRARALSEKGDILEEDPACIYNPLKNRAE